MFYKKCSKQCSIVTLLCHNSDEYLIILPTNLQRGMIFENPCFPRSLEFSVEFQGIFRRNRLGVFGDKKC